MMTIKKDNVHTSKPATANRYEYMVETLDGWQEWIDPDRRTAFVSQSCERATGLPAETLLSDPACILPRVHPDDRPRFLAGRAALIDALADEGAAAQHSVSEARAQYATRPPGEPDEFRLLSGSGEACWYARRGKAIFSRGGDFIGMQIVYSEIDAQKRSEGALRAAQQAVEALIQSSAVNFVLLDREGMIVFANAYLAQNLGRPLDALVGKLIWDYFPDDLTQTRKTVFERVLASGQAERYDDLGLTGLYDTTIYPVLNDAGQVVHVAVLARDISDRQQLIDDLRLAREDLEARVAERTAELSTANRAMSAEIARRELAEDYWQRHAAHAEALARVASRINTHLELDILFRTICEESLAVLPRFDLVWIGLYDESLDVIAVRAGAGTLPQVELAIPAMPRRIYEIILERFGSPIVLPSTDVISPAPEMDFIRRLSVQTLVSQPLMFDGEVLGYLTAADIGEQHTPDEAEIRLLQGLAEHARIAIVNAQMFRQLAESEAQLRALSERLDAVREEERRTLAQELHDECSPALTYLKMSLEAAMHSRGRPQTRHVTDIKMFDGLRCQVDVLLEKLRHMTLDLHPPALDDLGVFPALIDFIERFTERTGVKVHFKHSGLARRFPALIETTLYRIAQEGLTNVARHAQTNQAELLVWSDDERVGLKIVDLGVGFDLEQVLHRAEASGLAGMQARAVACSGSLAIESTIGSGTTLTLDIPLLEAAGTEEDGHEDQDLNRR